MHLVMFDIDGTLVDTSSFEDKCFTRAISSVLDQEIDGDWTSFKHVSDTGILNELISNIEDEMERASIFERIRSRFFELTERHLHAAPAPEIPGASNILNNLRQRDDVMLAIATGGWQRTAEMKLDSSGIDYSGISLASSDDHFDRTEIMRIAQQRTGENFFSSATYFGDGIWDKTASTALGFNFILVGNKTTHSKQIDDFGDMDLIESYIGL